MKKAIIFLIKIYQQMTVFFPRNCRYYPTCSNYCLTALEKHGFFTGLWLAIKRVGRCHPFNPGGYDPIP